jgi:hypothetical protein
VVEHPLVAAVVLNWRLPEAALTCAQDLAGCGYGPLEVLLVDNGSGDGSADRLLQGAGNGVEVQALDHNEGYCKAINRGLSWARAKGAEFVLLLNNDIRLPEGFLAPLVEVMVNDPEVAAAAPTALDPDGRVWCQGGKVGFFPNLAKLGDQNEIPAAVSGGPVSVDFVPGACAIYRLSDLEAVGDLDESYFMYVEDMDVCCKLRKAGKKVLWIPWTRVTHDVSASSGGGRTPLRKYLCALNTPRYLRAHGTARLWLAFVLFDLLGWPFALVTGGGFKDTWAKGRGAWEGLFGKRASADDVARWHR